MYYSNELSAVDGVSGVVCGATLAGPLGATIRVDGNAGDHQNTRVLLEEGAPSRSQFDRGGRDGTSRHCSVAHAEKAMLVRPRSANRHGRHRLAQDAGTLGDTLE